MGLGIALMFSTPSPGMLHRPASRDVRNAASTYARYPQEDQGHSQNVTAPSCIAVPQPDSRWRKSIFERRLQNPQGKTPREGTEPPRMRHHTGAAGHHEAGHDKKAAHHAQTVTGHAMHTGSHAENALTAHADERDKK
jgi:hypothetical protein